MARPKNQTDRRNQIVEAAGRAIAERGLSNVRIKDFADQAGMSSGSVLYYYPEIADLLVEVHRESVAHYYELRVSAVDRSAPPGEQLASALAAGIPKGVADPTARLLYEMHALCESSASHAKLMTSLFESEVTLYESILVAGSKSGDFSLVLTHRDVARTLVSLEDGLGLHVVSRNSALSSRKASAALIKCASVLTGYSF